MANNQQVMEAVIRMSGDMDKSVQTSMTKVGNAFSTLNKKCASFEKTAVKVGAAVAAAFTAAAASTAVAFAKAGDDLHKTMNSIAVKTGLTGAELEAVGKSAKEIWKQGMGESLQEVSDTLVSVKQTAGLAGKELENTAYNALLIKDAFGYEVEESVRAASAMMKNFGISAEEAYGLIAIGTQKGANKNGDLLDTLNEYSVHYNALGLSADQFVQSLISGAEAGSFSIDKVGDAVKEFTIRSKDGSKASLEAFQALGLNGEEMTRAFAEGGEEASEAFTKTLQALKEIEDPVKKNAAGVALFGTMFEDLEAGVIDTMLSMQNASLDAEESLKRISEVQYNDLGSSIEMIKRSLLAQLMPAAEKLAQAFQEKMPAIQAAIAKVEPIIADLADQFSNLVVLMIEGGFNLLPVIIEKLKEIVNWITENRDIIVSVVKWLGVAYATMRSFSIIAGIINNITTVYNALKTAIVAVKGATVLCDKAFKALTITNIKAKAAAVAHTVATKAQLIWTKAVTAAQWLWNAALTANPIGLVIAAVAALIAIGWVLYENWDTVCAFFKTAWEAVCDGLKVAWDWVCDALKAAWDLFVGALNSTWEALKSAWNTICEALKASWDWLCDAFKTAWEAIKNFFANSWEEIKSRWTTVFQYISGAWDTVCSGLKTAWEGVKSFFMTAVDYLSNIFSGLWDGVKSAAVTVFESIPAVIKTPINAVIAVVNGVIDKINGVGFKIPDWVPGIGGKEFSINIPKLPMLAAGGFTKGVSIAGEAGTEAVISFDPAYRKQNQAYLMTAAEMLGMNASPKETSNSTTINLGGITFQPVLKVGDNVDKGNILQQLQACLPDLLDKIESGLRERDSYRYV